MALVYGVGTNDADYKVSRINPNGKQSLCPFYAKWRGMLSRCYSEHEQKRHPTYNDCSVCYEWLKFSSFKSWMIKQDWKGKELDKDILTQGNKVYSPETCLFVDSKINKLLNNHKAKKGTHPQGVHFSTKAKKFKAIVNANGDNIYLGLFSSSRLAFEAYKTEKYKIISDVALQQTEPLKSALLNYKISED